jgi:hypothetical protein
MDIRKSEMVGRFLNYIFINMVFKVYIIPLGHNCNITFLLENVYKINQARNPFE